MQVDPHALSAPRSGLCKDRQSAIRTLLVDVLPFLATVQVADLLAGPGFPTAT